MASRVRLDGSHRSVCFMALFKPASEDTSEGWARAEAEAFRLWINKDKTDMYDLAVFVVIGSKFRLLHVANHPQIPTGLINRNVQTGARVSLEVCRPRFPAGVSI
ncbi:hypothetical protein B0I35DRAFT_483782 [Stachybotrys elegans]|uniref:Uncharacterized protein n=1 Tax=Stachybotrys elegans TaxID=80388 RepID=A0A8K0SK55_9HYPO|nr:hypothetical protein B0I35DRAFT_483782 [Stachybotrys elegans]